MADQAPTPKIDVSQLFDMFDKNNYSIASQKKAMDKVSPGFSDKYSDDDYVAFRQRAGKPIANYKKPVGPEPTNTDKVLQYLRPVLDTLVGGGVGAMSLPGGPGVAATAGLMAAGATDMGVKRAMSSPPQSTLGQAFGLSPGSPEDDITDTAETLGANELGGKITSNLFKGLSNLGLEKAVKGSVAGPLAKLDATFSQYYVKTFGDKPISKWVEDVFASGAKARAIENSGNLNMQAGTDLAKKITGRQNVTLDWLSDQMKVGAENQLAASKFESNRLSEIVKNISQANILAIPQNDGSVLAIKGPVNLGHTIQAAQDFLTQRTALLGDLTKANNEDQPLIAAAQRILQVSNAQFDDQTGQLIRSQPISFEDAWNFKKGADELGYGSGDKINTTFTGKVFQSLSRSLNDDIESSIGNWKNDPGKNALKSFQNAKATVAQRYNLFDEDGMRQLLVKNNSSVPAISSIINDPKMLQRTLSAGNLQLPSGKVTSTNMRRDLQGFKFVDILTNAYKADPVDSTKGVFDAAKASQNWNDPGFAESKSLLFNAQNRQDIDQFFKNLAMTQQKQIGGMMANSKLWMGAKATVMLGTAMVAGLDASPWASTALSVEVGAGVLSKWMTDPKKARLMVAMAGGQPLNMSQTLAAKTIFSGLQGYEMSINLKNGQKAKATVDRDGNIIPATNP